jgi:hypothetical protein
MSQAHISGSEKLAHEILAICEGEDLVNVEDLRDPGGTQIGPTERGQPFVTQRDVSILHVKAHLRSSHPSSLHDRRRVSFYRGLDGLPR